MKRNTLFPLIFGLILISIVSCVDRETVDRNPADGVFNGGFPSDSLNYKKEGSQISDSVHK